MARRKNKKAKRRRKHRVKLTDKKIEEKRDKLFI